MDNETEWDRTPKTDNETVFKGKTQPMTNAQTQLFVACSLAEGKGLPLTTEKELPFFSAVVKQRIESMKLPIGFTPHALLAINALADRVGSAVVILIDALTKYEGTVVTTSELADLYPSGFYDEETLTDYIDNYLKPRNPTKVKWAEIY